MKKRKHHLTIGILAVSTFLNFSASAFALDLSKLSSNQWDTYSGDDTHFDGNKVNVTPSEVRQIYDNLSNAIFGKRVKMTAGYAFDESYRRGFRKYHAGIDIGATRGTSVKTVVSGTTVRIDRGTKPNDYFVGVRGDDGNLWVYGHLGTISVNTKGVRINAGTTIGTIGSANHLHIEVQPGHTYRQTNGAHPDLNFVLNNTISPLEAYFRLNNRTPSPPSPSNNFSNPTSSLSVSVPTVDLTVQAANISGRTVYVQMFRPAFAGYAAKTWSFQQVASGNTVVFRDMDGAGNTFQGAPYSTVASLTPFTSNEASLQRTSCFAATGGARLCDRRSR